MVYTTPNSTTPIIWPVNCSNDTARTGLPSLPNITIKLRARRPTSLVSSQASAADEPLFMTSKPDRILHRSLSPISNRAPRKKSRKSEPNGKKRDDDPADENLAWDIIDREIAEWQTVCQTGRPSWWSPVPKWTQGGARSTWQEELRAIPPWRMNLDHGHRSEQRYDTQRRAVTDSYLADDKNLQDLAHVIAIQLLGACFTLPPEHISGYKSPAYNCFDTLGSSEIPDSRLISSLRMHTEARYSPSFGHQARNTSPAYRCQRAYDSQSPPRSHESSSRHHPRETKISKKTSRRQGIHRALHVTEGSAADCSMDSHSSLFEVTEVPPKGGEASDQQAESSTIPGRSIKSCPSTPGGVDVRPLHSSRLASEIFHGCSIDSLQDYAELRIHARPSSQSLQSVIPSEPHHIYIQPVKELVIRRWQKFRRRIGYSFGYGQRDPVRSKAQVMTSVSTSSRSTTFDGSTGSLRLSSDGKERRRQARERGDIHSTSIGSGSHNDIPIYAAGSGATSPDLLDHPSLDIEDTHTLGVAEAIANAFADSGLTTAVSFCTTPPNSQTSSNVPSPLAASTGSLNSRTDTGYFTSPFMSSSKPLQAPPTFSARRHGRLGQRKSMLSEVCTQEDTEGERSVFSAVGSPLASPREESGSEAAGALPSQIPSLDIEEEKLHVTETQPQTTASRPAQEEFLGLDRTSGEMRRRSVVRTNTSGTQVFIPSEDGIEIDGLPTGPPAQTWDDQRQEGKKRERSFL